MSDKSVFDKKAKEYDSEFTHSYFGKIQRQNIHDFVKGHLEGKSNLEILEINCGTGEDIPFLQQFGKVTATDVSEEMLERATKKNPTANIQKLDLNGPIQFEHKFDLIFSNFGGLNCVSPERLKELNKELRNQLDPGGQMILVFMHSWSLMEFFYFFNKLKWKKAVRRASKKAKFHEMDIYYYSGSEIKNIFADFTIEKKYATGIFLSGAYMNWLGKKLQIVEKKNQWLFPIWGADHRVYVMRKR